MALRLTGLNAKYMNQEMHMKKYDVTALGELLIDFTENGKSSQGNPLFEANPEEHLVMYLQCWRSWDIRQHLSGKWETISSENS